MDVASASNSSLNAEQIAALATFEFALSNAAHKVLSGENTAGGPFLRPLVSLSGALNLDSVDVKPNSVFSLALLTEEGRVVWIAPSPMAAAEGTGLAIAVIGGLILLVIIIDFFVRRKCEKLQSTLHRLRKFLDDAPSLLEKFRAQRKKVSPDMKTGSVDPGKGKVTSHDTGMSTEPAPDKGEPSNIDEYSSLIERYDHLISLP